MIHYHGTPFGGSLIEVAPQILGSHCFVSYFKPQQLDIVAELCQSFAIDNGAYSAWRSGATVNWREYFDWATDCRRFPNCDFGVIPDVIDGSEAENDRLLELHDWDPVFFAPVFHMHESLERLAMLVGRYPRVCVGSSGQYATVGNDEWWQRMADIMDVVCDSNGFPKVRLHGMRMLNPSVFQRLPLASADSTTVARNSGYETKWGPMKPHSRAWRGLVLRHNIEAFNAPIRWERPKLKKSRVGLID